MKEKGKDADELKTYNNFKKFDSGNPDRRRVRVKLPIFILFCNL